MIALLESLHAAFSDQARLENRELDQAIAIGLPTQRNEQWKYTSLRALSARRFNAPAAELLAINTEAQKTVAGIPSPRMVFVNGVFDAEPVEKIGLRRAILGGDGS